MGGCLNSCELDTGTTGRANVAVMGDVAVGKTGEGVTGTALFVMIIGSISAEGEMTGSVSPSSGKPVKFGGDGRSAKKAGFDSGMVTGLAT